jgi:hypothetical protein
MVRSLILDKVRAAPKKAVNYELDLAPALRKSSEHLKKSQIRAVAQRPRIAQRLPQYL